MVFIVWLLEAIHTGIIMHSVYTIAVDNFGNMAIFQTYSSFNATIIVAPLVGAVVEVFFMYRIHVLSGRWLVLTVPALAFVARAVVLTIFTIRLMTAGFPDFLKYRWAVISSILLACTINVSITVLLLYYLLKSRRASRRADKVIHRLILLTLESGLMITACGLSYSICYMVLPLNSAWMGLFAVWAKAYSISLFTSLNSRGDLQNQFSRDPTTIGPSIWFTGGSTGITSAESGASFATGADTKDEAYELGKPTDPRGKQEFKNPAVSSPI